ncbi:hypothetical protein [uncultured Croceitalea sp.]|uniref:hypothetical protein n=1 Tax=uncultured Croceitalea sp. TaxID=1798908 RepID=UPI003305B5F8
MDKLERHIKRKLEERKISPSNEAWQQIEASLGTQSKKTRKGTYWYAIAASLVGLLIISIVYFNAQDANKPGIEIVDVENIEDGNPKSIEQTKIVVEKEEENGFQVDKKNNIVNSNTNFIEEEVIKKDKGLVIVEPLSQQEKAVKDNVVITNAEDLIIDKKVEEVLATVISLESMTDQVTEAEIDSLLRSAQQEVLKERLFQQDGKVDAMALLNEVETELDQSFRNKIFEKLKQGFFKARTAVADRNN